MVEVEVFSPRKLQRALTFTDAEIEKEEMVTDMGRESGMGRFISEQVSLRLICFNFQKHKAVCAFRTNLVPEADIGSADTITKEVISISYSPLILYKYLTLQS